MNGSCGSYGKQEWNATRRFGTIAKKSCSILAKNLLDDLHLFFSSPVTIVPPVPTEARMRNPARR